MQGGIDRVSEEFWDIVCSDPELVELEFRAIMAGVRDEPMIAAMLRDYGAQVPFVVAEPLTPRGERAVRTRSRARSSIRSPPLRGADSVGT
ncbi:RagB/SusD family protein [Microbacterium sp. HM58-2]|nr:RagB/SusD family protein [Microbacterium sp. HM58-2]